MKIRVEVLPEAESQLESLDSWWREHRPAAARQVVVEFEGLVALLSAAPEIGAPYEHAQRPHLKWLRIQKTPYLVVYEHVPKSDLVSIVSVWSGTRGEQPPV